MRPALGFLTIQSARVRLGPLFLFLGLLVISEWLFLATKLSFLSGSPPVEKVGVGLAALLGLSFFTLLILLLLGLALESLGSAGALVFRLLVALATVFLMTLLLVQLLDNFFYTLFGIGLKMLSSAERTLASAMALLVFAQLFRRHWTRQDSRRLYSFASKNNQAISGLVALLVLLVCVFSIARQMNPAPPTGGRDFADLKRPNIVIIGIDALEASHVSAYGYEHNTTPFLLEKKPEFLIAENSFANFGITQGSIASLLTGKFPTSTRLFFAPGILVDEDQYEHFPALLRNQGYRSLDMSVRWYADPGDMNLRNGFEQANFRTIYPCAGGLGFELLCRHFSRSVFLVEQVADRSLEKLALLNPFSGAGADAAQQPGQMPHLDNIRVLRTGQPPHYFHEDGERIQQAIEFIGREEHRPFFVHLHLMAPHDPVYSSMDRLFSKGMNQTSKWQSEFYDDSIRRADAHIREIYEYLERDNLLSNTIVVITSDHGRNWGTHNRLPLMIRFPGAEFNQVVSTNTQRVDVAPTLLDYMDWEIPAWMEGASLLAMMDDEEVQPPVFSARGAALITASGESWVQHSPQPPFYALAGVALIVCDRLFGWYLPDNTWALVKIEGHTRPCEDSAVPAPELFQDQIRQHLADRGYRVDTLGNPQQAVQKDKGRTRGLSQE